MREWTCEFVMCLPVLETSVKTCYVDIVVLSDFVNEELAGHFKHLFLSESCSVIEVTDDEIWRCSSDCVVVDEVAKGIEDVELVHHEIDSCCAVQILSQDLLRGESET